MSGGGLVHRTSMALRERHLRNLLEYPGRVVAAFAIVTAVFGIWALRVTKDNSFRSLFPPTAPAIVDNDRIKDLFNLRDPVVIAIVSEDTVFNHRTLAIVADITTYLEGTADISTVRSLANVSDVRADADSLETIVPFRQCGGEVVPCFRDAIERLGRLKENLLAPDRRATFIYAQPSFPMDDNARAVAFYGALSTFVEQFNRDGHDAVYLTGFPVVLPLMSQAMTTDLRHMLPAVVGIQVLLLAVYFRSLAGVLLPVTEVLCSLIWAFGLMGIVGSRLSVVGLAMPVLLLAYGIADDLFFLIEYRRQREAGVSKRDAVRETVTELWVPHILTNVTSMVGFLSFASTDMNAVRDFGVYASFGILASLLFSIALVPAALLLLPDQAIRPRAVTARGVAQAEGEPSWLGAWIAQTSGSTMMIPIAAVATLAIALGFAWRVEVRHSAVEFFLPGSRIRTADEMINARGGATAQFSVVFENGAFKSAPFLKALQQMQRTLETVPGVRTTLSPADFVEHMLAQLREPNAEPKDLFDTDALVAQALMLYELGGWGPLEHVAAPDLRAVNLIVAMNENNTPAFARVKQAIVAAIEQTGALAAAGPGTRVAIAGFPNINLLMLSRLVTSLASSVVTSLIPIVALLLLTFGSWRLALIALVPIGATLVTVAALMGAAGIPLNVVTCLIAGVVMGMGIDYSIHVVSRAEAARKVAIGCGAPSAPAVVQAVARCAVPVFVNAGTVALGFMVLSMSEFLPLRHLGILLAGAMVVSAGGVVFGIPYLLLHSERHGALSAVAAKYRHVELAGGAVK